MLLVIAAPTGREATLRAWLGGAGFFIVISHWLVPKVGPGLVPIAMLLGLSWIPWGWVAWHGSRARALPAAVVATSAAWVAGEFVRSTEYLGGPWGLLGASQWNNLPVLEFLSRVNLSSTSTAPSGGCLACRPRQRRGLLSVADSNRIAAARRVRCGRYQ